MRAIELADGRIIAVIDDDKGMRVSLDSLLRSLGYHTALFDSAGLADCVISDVALPSGMSDLELARRLADERPGIPVILVSGCADRGCREKAEALGVEALLAKPFDDEMLIGFLNRVLTWSDTHVWTAES